MKGDPAALQEASLLEAIVADVDAVEPRLVYADALIQRGDPRGNLIVAQHRLLQDPTDRALAEHVRALVEQVIAQLDAPKLATSVIRRWWLGFVDELGLARRTLHAVMQGKWLAQPALRMVRALDLWASPAKGARAILGKLPTVRAISVGERGGVLPRDMLREIAVPRLTSVVVRSQVWPALDPLAPVPLTAFGLELRDMLVPAQPPWDAVRDWPLRSLALRNYDFPGTMDARIVEGLRPALDGDVFPELRHLAVIGPSPRMLIEAVASRPLAARLETLELSYNQLADTDLRWLRRHRVQLANVRLVDDKPASSVMVKIRAALA